MRVVANYDTQVRIGKKIHFYRGGESPPYDFEKCPEHFSPVDSFIDEETKEVDFDSMSKEAIEALEPGIDELKSFIKKKYPSIQFARNIGFDTLLDRYLNARVDVVNIVDNTGKTTPKDVQNGKVITSEDSDLGPGVTVVSEGGDDSDKTLDDFLSGNGNLED